MRQVRKENGTDLTDQIEVTGVTRTADGTDINRGHAAREKLASSRRVTLDGDRITVEDDADITTAYTEFAAIPGRIVIVSSKQGRFLFDLLGDETGTEISRDTSTSRGL